jgi:hypothetical protein
MLLTRTAPRCTLANRCSTFRLVYEPASAVAFSYCGVHNASVTAYLLSKVKPATRRNDCELLWNDLQGHGVNDVLREVCTWTNELTLAITWTQCCICKHASANDGVPTAKGVQAQVDVQSSNVAKSLPLLNACCIPR